jgi:hypothetical protein
MLGYQRVSGTTPLWKLNNAGSQEDLGSGGPALGSPTIWACLNHWTPLKNTCVYMLNDGINDGINNGISWLVVGNMIFSTHTYIYILIENNDPN